MSERSSIASHAARARWARTTPEERRAATEAGRRAAELAKRQAFALLAAARAAGIGVTVPEPNEAAK